MKSEFEIFLDTDVYLKHLQGDDDSVLLKCLSLFDCYTSVINASEVFAECRTKEQEEKSKQAFFGSGVLGIPYKYSHTIGRLLKENVSYRDACVISILIETKLPIVSFTNTNSGYAEKYGIKFIQPQAVQKYNTPQLIFSSNF
jgi:hypothetical protein